MEKKDIIEKVRATLYLDYYESYLSAISYQNGGCGYLAMDISSYLSKYEIEHEICVLCGYEQENKVGLVEGTHFFIKIEDKYYDSFNFGAETTDMIYYQFEDVDLYDKFITYDKVTEFKKSDKKNEFEESVQEKEILLNNNFSLENIEKFGIQLAIENNKNVDDYQYSFHLPDIDGYEAANKLDPSINKYCQTAIINALNNKLFIPYLKATHINK